MYTKAVMHGDSDPIPMTTRRNNPTLRLLIDFWSRYCELLPWHIAWARQYVTVLSALKKNQQLYLEGESQKYVYLVTKGMLARVDYHPTTGKRRILSVALPGMALMTTAHLYSGTPSKGDIIVLRSDSCIAEIPYRAIKEFKTQEPHIDTLIDILGNKKRNQLAKLRLASSPDYTAYEKYLSLVQELPELYRTLTHQEIADILSISIITAKRCAKKMAKSPHTVPK